MEFIINLANEIAASFKSIEQSSPIIAGAIALWGLGLLSFLLIRLPKRIGSFIRRTFTTRLELTVDSEGTLRLSKYLMEVIDPGIMVRFSRVYKFLVTGWSATNTTMTFGEGKHYFRYKGRLLSLREITLPSEGSERIKRKYTITVLGRNRKILDQLAKEVIPVKVENSNTMTKVYVPNKDGAYWTSDLSIPNRTEDSLAIDTELLESIKSRVAAWKNSKDVYARAGVPWKLSLLFYGKPGTGKTSLIKLLASITGRSICTLSLQKMSLSKVESLLRVLPKKALLLLEDIDDLPMAKSRDVEDTEIGYVPGLSLGQFLNLLDGVCEQNNLLICSTTNHPDKIDSAILRKGRMDAKFEIPFVGANEAKRYIDYVNGGDFDITNFESLSIPGCELADLVLLSENDKEITEGLLKFGKLKEPEYHETAMEDCDFSDIADCA